MICLSDNQRGDLQQVKALRYLYNLDLMAKEELDLQASKEDLTPYQIGEINVKLVKITGEMRRKDSLINYLVFGTQMEENYIVKSVYWYWEKLRNQDERKRVRQLRNELHDAKRSLADISDKYSKLAIADKELND